MNTSYCFNKKLAAQQLIKLKLMKNIVQANTDQKSACNFMHYVRDTIKDIEYNDNPNRQRYINQAYSLGGQ